MLNEWWVRKAEVVGHFADTQNSKMFFSAMIAIYGPPDPSTTLPLSSNGETLLKKNNINNW